MDGGDHHAAAGAMFSHKLRHQRAAFDVQSSGRFVQQPDWTRLDQQANQSPTALLASREPPARHLFTTREPDALHGPDGFGGVATKIAGPEFGLLGGAFRGFYRIEMPEIVSPRLILSSGLERHRTVMRAGQTGENAKQGRLARPVGPTQFEHFPTGKTESQPLEQDAQPARRREIFDLKDQ